MRLPNALLTCLAVCAAFTLEAGASARDGQWQCVTFARAHSGVEIRGNAHTWWDQAHGRYVRSSRPDVGAVLVMKSFGNGGMRLGHVATVSRVVSDREVLITHANWQGDGRVEENVRAVDVSPEGDWSRVRVWYAPVGDLGRTAYPAYGFILPAPADAGVVDTADIAAP